jgi:methylmalonyl-CoA/ethylmalonyl-CoA epimerase
MSDPRTSGRVGDGSAPVSRTGVQLTRAVQIGIVVRDVEQSARRLTELFGIGPFRFIEWPNRPDSGYWYRGDPQPIRLRQAFAQAGTLELELIQPLEGERNAYREFLDRHGPGIHHVLFETSDMQAVVNAAAIEGVDVLQAGTGIRPGTRWSLLDSVDAVGFLLEVREVAPGCDGTSIPRDGT